MRVKVLPTVNIFITLQSILCWIKLTQGEGDISVKNRTDVSCELTFSRNLEKCLKLSKFYKFLSSDGVKINLMVALFLDFHCSQYKQSLQCTNEQMAACSTRETIQLVQSNLNQLWALTANYLCDINQENPEMKKFSDSFQNFHTSKNFHPMASVTGYLKIAEKLRDTPENLKTDKQLLHTHSYQDKNHPRHQQNFDNSVSVFEVTMNSKDTLKSRVAMETKVQYPENNLQSQKSVLEFETSKQSSGKSETSVARSVVTDRKTNNAILETNNVREWPSYEPSSQSI